MSVTTQQPPARDPGESEALTAVVDVLWSEREMLESLLFKLVEEQFILTSGAARWLNRADAEVRVALKRLRASEIVRAAEVDALVRLLGLAPETTLRRLAETVRSPWSVVFADHRAALLSLAAEVEAVATENKRLLDEGSQAIRETLECLQHSVAGYHCGADSPAAGDVSIHLTGRHV